MFTRYFQDELGHLKDLAVEFSKEHPALAPMLSGPTADPDVERLLEGVAFLTAMLREKLDDEFPEIIHELMNLIWPHYLRPIPCTTIVAFEPKPTLKQPIEVPSGIYLSSIPIEGTSCLFRTTYGLEIHPLKIIDATYKESPGKPPGLSLTMELNGLKLSDWEVSRLRFYLSEDYATASNIYLLLQRFLRKIILRPLEGGKEIHLPPELLIPVGYSDHEGLLPYPSNSFPGYRVFQEYFILPEKFLFLELQGWENWNDRGEGHRFEIFFELDDFSLSPPRIKKEHFVLFATPAINIFPHEADPIRLDHRKTDYLIRPSATNVSHYQVYSVEKVLGYVQGTAKEKVYRAFELFDTQDPDTLAYHVKLRSSPVKRGMDVYLSIAYPRSAGMPQPETLSVSLMCTNGSLPESLQLGDLSQPTSTSPEFVSFKNIRPMTPNILPPLGTNLLWKLLSHLSLNYLSLADVKNLKALLDLYIFHESRDRASVLANKKRIDGIEDVKAVPKDRIVSGASMRGQEIEIKIRHDHFASEGDLFLFGSVLDYFLGCYSAINTYTQLKIEETIKGDVYIWPAKVGDQPLL